MFESFVKATPIRAKLLISYGTLIGLTAIVALASLLPGMLGFAVGVAATVISCLLGMKFRSMIADPYVATVVRMEGLAAGDLASPIAFTDYTDCVGRMTTAMATFRETANAVNRLAAINEEVVAAIGVKMNELAGGDLSADITADFPESFVELKNGFNAALINLRELIGGVTHSADGIRTGSAEIAQASEDLARRTESNAASLEETSAALTQIDGRLKATALSSSQTVTRADQAIATVDGGRVTAEEAVQAMGRVSDSAKGIDSVIEGLDKIAFQTRVLAMNAAVEAGRAGDAGRGFAVVADLVSALAMRAEEEAKRARDQLTVTQSEIGSAVDAVRRVDTALANISGDVAVVHKLLGTMADDATAQSSAITQISAAIGAMDQSTQQNAAMVEETSAAARNLSTEVSALSEQTAMFTIGTRSTGRRKAEAPRAAPAARTKSSAPYRSPITALAPQATRDAVPAGGDDWNAF